MTTLHGVPYTDFTPNPSGNWTIPVATDGSSYAVAVGYGNRGRAAHTCGELLDLINPGYNELDTDEDRFAARIWIARGFADSIARRFFDEALLNGAAGGLSAGEVDALNAPHDEPYTDRFTGSWEWSANVPLVCVDADHAKGVRPAPTGSVVWIGATEERDLLDSLSRITSSGVVFLQPSA